VKRKVNGKRGDKTRSRGITNRSSIINIEEVSVDYDPPQLPSFRQTSPLIEPSRHMRIDETPR